MLLNKSHRNSQKNVKSTIKGAGEQHRQAHSFTGNCIDHIGIIRYSTGLIIYILIFFHSLELYLTSEKIAFKPQNPCFSASNSIKPKRYTEKIMGQFQLWQQSCICRGTQANRFRAASARAPKQLLLGIAGQSDRSLTKHA